MAITDKLKVTRDQLAEFIKSHNTIRQFERLFEYVNTFVIEDWQEEIDNINTELNTKITGSEAQICKAWVNFNGIGTVEIRDSFNVSSITDNGTGDYTINFTTDLSDTKGSIVSTAIRTIATPANTSNTQSYISAVGTAEVDVFSISGARVDAEVISVQVFGS